MTPEQFESWLADPVTEAVMQYLKDFASAARMEWAMGNGWSQEAALKVEAFEDLSDIDLESVLSFYDEIGDRLESLRLLRRAITTTEKEDEDDGHNTA